MKQVILNFPKQFTVGLERAKDIKINPLTGGFKNIIICGLGGSALPGVLLMDYINDLEIPVYIHRSYGLPPQANKNSLIFSISFSGNTEETLSGYQEALDKKFNVVAITTGGALEQIAKKNNLPLVIIPNDCLQPRFGTGYLFATLIKVLSNSKVIENKDEEITQLKNIDASQFEEQGKQLAKKLKNKVPVIYSTATFKSIARIWKIKFNENSKIMAFWNYFPELNHNEMVGLTNLVGNFSFLILRDQESHPRNLKRIDLFVELATEKGAEVNVIAMSGKNKLEKMFNTLILGDWISYYLALEYGQDPVPVKIVEEFKKRLKD